MQAIGKAPGEMDPLPFNDDVHVDRLKPQQEIPDHATHDIGLKANLAGQIPGVPKDALESRAQFFF
jgi:hypothetical protein